MRRILALTHRREHPRGRVASHFLTDTNVSQHRRNRQCVLLAQILRTISIDTVEISRAPFLSTSLGTDLDITRLPPPPPPPPFRIRNLVDMPMRLLRFHAELTLRNSLWECFSCAFARTCALCEIRNSNTFSSIRSTFLIYPISRESTLVIY